MSARRRVTESTGSSSSSSSSSSGSSSSSDSSSSDSESSESQSSAPSQNENAQQSAESSDSEPTPSPSPKKANKTPVSAKKTPKDVPKPAAAPPPTSNSSKSIISKVKNKQTSSNTDMSSKKKAPPPSSKKSPARAPPSRSASLSKTKSIFSPDNSSASEDKDGSSLDSSSEAESPKRTVKKDVTKTKSSPIKTKAVSRSKPVPKSRAHISSDSENDSKPSSVNSEKGNKKCTRSSTVRPSISKHVLGKTSGSDSEADGSSSKSAKRKPSVTTSSGGSGRKGGKIPVRSQSKSQHVNAKNKNNRSPSPPVDRICPVSGCDSSGHLNGKYEKHFTFQACPQYHNLTGDQCLAMRVAREAREVERKTMEPKNSDKPFRSPRHSHAATSHHHAPTSEQRQYQLQVRQARNSLSEKSEVSHTVHKTADGNLEKEPLLGGLTSDYDLQLFLEAQAEAAEKLEDELRLLPAGEGMKLLEMGRFEMQVWYQSPYPDEIAKLPKVFVCEFCLQYMKSRTVLRRHAAKCVWKHPPGDEIYRKDKVSVWEVNGEQAKTYCQNLCLLAKCFLDHKTLYYDVEPFLFYVMTVADCEGCHTVGYFSKEKNSFLNYNVSCIMTLPPYQRQGYGRLLIDFSYLLTRTEKKIGSPEKPLSDLGLISYRAYWKDVLLQRFLNFPERELSIKDLSQELAINASDIVSTLQVLGMLKYWKGKHIILKRQDILEDFEERSRRRGPDWRNTDASCLRWRPYVPPQSS